MKATKEARIRNRGSYIMFKELYRFLANEPSIKDVMQKCFDVLDERHCFGSLRNSNYAKERMKLALKNGENRFKVVIGDKGIRFVGISAGNNKNARDELAHCGRRISSNSSVPDNSLSNTPICRPTHKSILLPPL